MHKCTNLVDSSFFINGDNKDVFLLALLNKMKKVIFLLSIWLLRFSN